MSHFDLWVPLQMPSAVVRSVTTPFKAVAEQHNFPPDFPSQEVARGLLARLLANPGFYSVVAEFDGTIVGSNFVDERSTIAGLGPITVDPAVQNRAVGRQLMQNALDRVRQEAFPGVQVASGRVSQPLALALRKIGIHSPRATLHHARACTWRAHSRLQHAARH